MIIKQFKITFKIIFNVLIHLENHPYTKLSKEYSNGPFIFVNCKHRQEQGSYGVTEARSYTTNRRLAE